ncbi:VOC family protein [Montanilutibacter psychrotolerans]|uniref:VOC family protein n=1 Tax=Montanilutibacter psychrotolerans TaxID=1327343 RepID=A0A3M8SWZ8_9GAMM|nr:VOC family protein [Lysobacter psychrotolerans]RNF85887.1 VOC family protein [Lysobacter psychrotolerans]
MPQTIGYFTLLVRDYDAAIAWFTGVLGFELREDTDLGNGKRWVRVTPPGSGANATGLLLARAVGDAQIARIGDQTGGRVGYFLHSDDFDRDFAAMTARGVRFLEAPRREAYGSVAVFEDLCGNRWDLLEHKA